MDIGRAFTFFADDPEWIKKVLLAALISLIPFVGGFLVLGWALVVTRNVYYGSDTPLPDWSDFGDHLVRGLVAWVGAFIWALPVVILSFCLVGALIAAGDSNAAVAFIVLASIAFAFIFIAYLAIFLPIPIARYAIHGNFSSMFEFGQILKEIQRGIRPLLIALVIWLIAAMIIAPIGIIACFVGVYVTTALSYLMIAHAMGQAYREIDRPGPPTSPPAF